MGVSPGFKSEDHRQRFEEGRARRRRGGPEAPVCGAPTRDGRPCGRAPVDGRRCEIHGGKREGGVVIMPDRAAKAARNRLSYRWRRDGAWVPGQTLSLGQFEMAFREDLLAAGVVVLTLAPAVVDKARWRWRRYRLDRRDELAWFAFAHSELPALIAVAGPPPAGWDAGAPCPIDGLVPIIAEPPAPGSKRRLPGRPASGVKRTKPPVKRTKPSADRYAVEQLKRTCPPSVRRSCPRPSARTSWTWTNRFRTWTRTRRKLTGWWSNLMVRSGIFYPGVRPWKCGGR